MKIKHITISLIAIFTILILPNKVSASYKNASTTFDSIFINSVVNSSTFEERISSLKSRALSEGFTDYIIVISNSIRNTLSHNYSKPFLILYGFKNTDVSDIKVTQYVVDSTKYYVQLDLRDSETNTADGTFKPFIYDYDTNYSFKNTTTKTSWEVESNNSAFPTSIFLYSNASTNITNSNIFSWNGYDCFIYESSFPLVLKPHLYQSKSSYFDINLTVDSIVYSPLNSDILPTFKDLSSSSNFEIDSSYTYDTYTYNSTNWTYSQTLTLAFNNFDTSNYAYFYKILGEDTYFHEISENNFSYTFYDNNKTLVATVTDINNFENVYLTENYVSSNISEIGKYSFSDNNIHASTLKSFNLYNFNTQNNTVILKPKSLNDGSNKLINNFSSKIVIPKSSSSCAHFDIGYYDIFSKNYVSYKNRLTNYVLDTSNITVIPIYFQQLKVDINNVFIYIRYDNMCSQTIDNHLFIGDEFESVDLGLLDNTVDLGSIITDDTDFNSGFDYDNKFDSDLSSNNIFDSFYHFISPITFIFTSITTMFTYFNEDIVIYFTCLFGFIVFITIVKMFF